MSSEANSREARRRRIVDRGIDRLALITGRIQSLPDAPPPPPPLDADNRTPPVAASLNRKVKVEEGQIPEPDIPLVELQSSKIYTETVAKPRDPEPRPIGQSSENIPPESSERPESSLGHSVSLTAPIPQQQTRKHQLPFNPRKISSAVTETESLRNFCSLVVACMVVMSYAGFPILRTSLIKKVIFFRPLVLLLLTNITIVVAPLLGEQQGGTERSTRESDEVSAEGSGMAEQLGNALEIGLLVQKVFGALFMDCSIYSVVVISGLSLF